ncbi:MAG: M50 family metallopeptidase [Bacillaceae bacterium]|nr:M50 family metallopeptidase [Bacillaceae bacterium]
MLKKTLFFILYLLVCAAIGATIGILLSYLPDHYKVLPGYAVFLIFIFTYFLAIALHELGHAISIVRHNIPLRALMILMFLFIKIEGKWKLRFTFTNILGGLAVPDMPVVKDKQTFTKMQKAYAKILLAGPIASILMWLILSAASIILLLISSNSYMLSGALTFLLSLTAITIFLLSTCFIKNEYAVGDFPAYQLAKKETFFAAYQFYQYAYFSSSPKKNRDENEYVRNVLLEELEQKLQNKDTHVYTIGVLDILLVEYLAGVTDELPNITEAYIDFILNDEESLLKLKETETGIKFYFHIIQLQYIIEDKKQVTSELYDNFKKELKMKTPVIQYLIKQTDHFIGIEDHSLFLSDNSNIRVSQLHNILKNFDGFMMDEILLNKKIIKES